MSRRLGTGVAFLDFDNDGLLDIFAVTASKLDGFAPGTEPVNRLYRNKGNRTFEDVSKKAGVAKAGWGQGVCTGDIDNDGFVDLYVTYWGADVMYRNRGDGTFEDVTPPGIGSRWGTGCAFVDYDRDGKAGSDGGKLREFRFEEHATTGWAEALPMERTRR